MEEGWLLLRPACSAVHRCSPTRHPIPSPNSGQAHNLLPSPSLRISQIITDQFPPFAQAKQCIHRRELLDRGNPPPQRFRKSTYRGHRGGGARVLVLQPSQALIISGIRAPCPLGLFVVAPSGHRCCMHVLFDRSRGWKHYSQSWRRLGSIRLFAYSGRTAPTVLA